MHAFQKNIFNPNYLRETVYQNFKSEIIDMGQGHL